MTDTRERLTSDDPHGVYSAEHRQHGWTFIGHWTGGDFIDSNEAAWPICDLTNFRGPLIVPAPTQVDAAAREIAERRHPPQALRPAAGGEGGSVKITKRMLDALQDTEWGMEHFGSIVTNRQLPLAVMRQCIAAGLCKSIGPVVEDGFCMETERWREGYQLTPAGRQVLDEFYASMHRK